MAIIVSTFGVAENQGWVVSESGAVRDGLSLVTTALAAMTKGFP